MIKAYKKWSKFFFINLIAGGFAFFMMISLQLLNQLDAIWHYGYGGAGNWERNIGRWVWPYIDELRFGLFTDPFCNILALCFFILGNILLFEVIGFEPGMFRTYAVSLMFIISTSVCAWLSFRYMSNTFAMAYFFSMLSVYFCKCGVKIKLPEKIKLKKQELLNTAASVVLASVSLMLSLGSYQAFFDSVCLVLLTAFMLMLYRNEEKRELIGFFVRSIVSIVCGTVLYFAGMKISFHIHGIEQLNSYNEGASLGLGNSIMKIPGILEKTVYYFRQYFFGTMFRWNRLQENGLFRALVFGLIIAAFVTGIVRICKKNKIYAVLFAICGLLMPVAANVVLFMATESYLSIQMTNGLALFVSLSFVLIFEITGSQKNAAEPQEEKEHGHGNITDKVVRFVVALTCVFVIYGNYVSTQIDQEACREGITGTVNIAGEVLDSLKYAGVFDRNQSVCFVGAPCGNERFMYSEIYPMANGLMQFGNWERSASTHRQTWVGIYREFFGYYVAPCSDEEYDAILSRDDVAAMPMFPRTGSIRDIDGIIVVKISNNY